MKDFKTLREAYEEIYSEADATDDYGRKLLEIVRLIQSQPVPEAITTLGEFAHDMKYKGYENAKRDFGFIESTDEEKNKE